MSHWDLHPETTLSSLFEECRRARSTLVASNTSGMTETHARHICSHFGLPVSITQASIADYCRERLGKVKRKTVQKELSTLRVFLAWCQERGYCQKPPEVPSLPKRATGTAAMPPRRVTPLSPEECRAIIAHLPEWASAKGQVAFPVRAKYEVAHETGLRPATLKALSVPEHYSKGAPTLFITDDIDKARFGRELPLTLRARAALDRVCPTKGLIFGSHDDRHQIERAARKALTSEKARTFSAYDFRHARATEWAGTGDMKGTAFLLGHKQMATTNIYVHPNMRDAQRVLDSASGSPTRRGGSLVGDEIINVSAGGARKRTRTSTSFRTLEPESRVPLSLSGRARALLEDAAVGGPVDNTELYAFARAASVLSELSKLIIAVLDGGAFARVRAVELAELVVATEENARERRNGDS